MLQIKVQNIIKSTLSTWYSSVISHFRLVCFPKRKEKLLNMSVNNGKICHKLNFHEIRFTYFVKNKNGVRNLKFLPININNIHQFSQQHTH